MGVFDFSHEDTAVLIHPEVMGVEALFEKMRKIPNWPEEGILFQATVMMPIRASAFVTSRP